jgi:putative membrane protein
VYSISMSPEVRAIFEEWSLPVILTVAVLLCAILYTSGWYAIRRTRLALFPVWRLAAFLLGLAILWLSIGSPLDGLADTVLSAHMIEHLLLMSFVPPLLLLGLPVVPLLRGLPRGIVVVLLGPLLRLGWLRKLGHLLTLPVVAWFAMNLAFLGWHVPAAYDFALEHEHWHEVEHICFLGSSILFWYPVMRPWPIAALNPGWFLLPYLVAADLVNTALSAFLAFCDRPVYKYYLTQPNPFHLSPLSDQRIGAVLMWVIGSVVFLVPAAFVTLRNLHHETRFAPKECDSAMPPDKG